jgi:glycosyltransferase involved in cell wall biosynthesis
MRVLVVSRERFLPADTPHAKWEQKLADKLVERGHSVTVFAPLDIGSEEIRQYEVRHNLKLANAELTPGMDGGLGRAAYCAAMSLKVSLMLARGGYDVLLSSNYLLTTPQMMLCRPCVSALSISNPKGAFLSTGCGGMRKAVLGVCDRAFPRLFDLVFVTAHEMRMQLIADGCTPSRVHLTYRGADTDVFSPGAVVDGDVGAIRAECGLSGRIVIFSGAIDERVRVKLKEVINAATSLRKDMTFIVLGEGPEYGKARSELESEAVRFPGKPAREKMPAYIAAADAGFILHENPRDREYVLPDEILRYLALGLPVASSNLKAAAELFGAYDFIMFSDESGQLAKNLSILVDAPKSQAAVDLVLWKYSWDAAVTDMVETIESKHKRKGD